MHGVAAWLDEQQLRVGTRLSVGLQRHIGDCDTVVVVASAASADSKWVGLELDCAAQLGKDIVPWLVEPVASHPRFADHAGVAVAGPAHLGESLERLLTSLCSAWDRPVPTARRDACEACLRDLCRQVAALEGLVLGCLDGPGLLGGSESSVAAAGFGPVDEALELLAEWEPSERIAAHLSWGFVELGAAQRALRRWVDRSGDGGVVLAVLADSARLPPAQDDATLALFERCSRPNNQALYGYIHRRADRLTKHSGNGFCA